MCYHVSSKLREELEDRYDARINPDHREAFEQELEHANGFAHPALPVITDAEPGTINMYHWGLIPEWVRDIDSAMDMQKKCLNAKAETVFELKSFKNLIRQKRCIVLVDGFYEWKHEGRKKIPYYISYSDGQPLAMGGIWNTWIDSRTNVIFNTFSILTTPANPLMAEIHNTKRRMPLMLPRETEKEWLQHGLSEAHIQLLTTPLDERYISAKRIL